MSSAQVQLDRWAKEHDVVGDILFGGYANLGKGTLAICRYVSTNMCEVQMAEFWKDMRAGWLRDSVLWHEFCHAQAYLEDGDPNGHDARWRELRNSKPKYRLGDALASLLYSPKTW